MAERPDNPDFDQIGSQHLNSGGTQPADDKGTDPLRPDPGFEADHGRAPSSTGDTALFEKIECRVIDFKSASSGVNWRIETCYLSELTSLNSGILKKLDADFQESMAKTPEHSHNKSHIPSPGQFRWIHIPANNSKWAELVNGNVRAHLGHPNEAPGKPLPSFYDKSFFTRRANASKTKQFHARSMKPYCERWEGEASFPVKSELVLFMPYIHWERVPHYEKMRRVVQHLEKTDAPEGVEQQLLSDVLSLEEQLIRKYLPDNHLHIRRSLDQSYYSTIADTTERDGDQVVDRYARNELKKRDNDRPMLMVDQLWLRVLDEKTIISSFPHTWAHLEPQTGDNLYNDPLDVYNQIVEYLTPEDKRIKFDTALKVAFLIIHRCAGNVVDEKMVDQSELQFIEYFDRSIDILMNKQRKCLENLAEAIKETSKEYLKKNHRRTPDHSKLLETTSSSEAMKLSETTKSSEITKLPNPTNPFDIQEEFLILREIRDVTEEIHMLVHIVELQQDALEALSSQYRAHSSGDGVKTLSLPGRTGTHVSQSEDHRDNQDTLRWRKLTGGSIASPVEENMALQQKADPGRTGTHVSQSEDHRDNQDTSRLGKPTRGSIAIPVQEKTALQPKADLETLKTLGKMIQSSETRMQILRKLHGKAQHVDRSIVRQLDLKQKSASTLSADRMVRIAEESEKQSNAIMLFTVVTILFLPLSSIAGIFGMNAKEFGQGLIPLSHLFKILFPVSIACIVVTFFLAFNEKLRNILLLSFQIPWTLFIEIFPSLDRIESAMQSQLAEIKKNAKDKAQSKVEEKGKVKSPETTNAEDAANGGGGVMAPNDLAAAPKTAASQTPLTQVNRRSADEEEGGIPKA